MLKYQGEGGGWLLLNLAAAKTGCQRVVRESLRDGGNIGFREQVARDGAVRFHGIAAPNGELVVNYEAEVERDEVPFDAEWCPPEVALVDLPHEVSRFLYPSRYCESDKLARMAFKQFGGIPTGHERVVAICNWIRDHIDYEFGTTDQHTSAVDCLTSRVGVCRDFAHLGIAFCRALGIPARYASVYAFGLVPPDFHAVFEVWLGGKWWFYDATRLAPQAGFILVGTGHDAADTSVATMSLGVSFQYMEISIEKLTPAPVAYTIEPVSFGSAASSDREN